VHSPVDSAGGGIIDIAAPFANGSNGSGSISGIAIMQDSRINGSKDLNDITYSGNSPTLDIQGYIYIPNSNLTIGGAINLHTSGLSCIGIIANTITINGQGSIFVGDTVSDTKDCGRYLTNLPTVPNSVQTRQALVG
jgi:hypothetical protein